MTAQSYRSLFLDPESPLDPYLGWRRRGPNLGRAVFERTLGPFKRRLILVDALGDVLPRQADGLFDGASAVHVHDFSAEHAAPAVVIGGRILRPAAPNERVLNVATFVVELSATADELLDRFKKGARGMVRKALLAGARADLRPADAAAIDRFMRLYLPMAKSRSLAVPPRSSLAAMASDGRLLAATAEAGASEAVNLVYAAGSKAYYLHGATSDPGNLGLGNLAQWATMRALRERGVRWYDLGGVPAVDESNGIYKFKRSFGGELVLLGQEFLWSRPGFSVAAAMARAARGLFK